MTGTEKLCKCEGCGQDIKIMKLPILGGSRKGEIDEFRSPCICTDKSLAEEVVKDREMKKHQRAIEMFERFSLIPPELQAATFETYIPKNKEMDYAMRLTKRYVDVFDKAKPMNLLIHGSYGVGKSHLCVALQKELMKKGITCIFVFLPDLLDMFTDTYNKNSEMTEGEIMKALKSVDLLVIDDVAAEGTLSQFALRKQGSIVNGRQGSHTIFTSNFPPDQLFDLLGERIFSRMLNKDSEVCAVDGENDRLQKFKKKSVNENENEN